MRFEHTMVDEDYMRYIKGWPCQTHLVASV